MKRFLLAVLALFWASTAFAQTVYSPDAFGAPSVTISANGTTAAVVATIAAVAGKTAYLCGFSIRSNATAAVTGDATVAGVKSGTMTFKQFVAPVASGIGVLEPPLGSCIPASGANIAIVITSLAAGAAGLTSVNAWGFYQ